MHAHWAPTACGIGFRAICRRPPPDDLGDICPIIWSFLGAFEQPLRSDELMRIFGSQVVRTVVNHPFRRAIYTRLGVRPRTLRSNEAQSGSPVLLGLRASWCSFSLSSKRCSCSVFCSPAGLESGPHVPLIHVDTPSRGNTHICRVNHTAKTASRINALSIARSP